MELRPAVATSQWRQAGLWKREHLQDLIPKHWRLPRSIGEREELKDVTGDCIQRFLSAREVEITETDACEIVAKTTSGTWTALEVVLAFCHRAALAHQMVVQEQNIHDGVLMISFF